MQIRQIECFLALSEELHFSRAAQRLGLSQPPLTKHIQQLEQELGVKLFHRNRRSVSLTEAGKVYREHVSKIFDQLEHARMAAQRAQAGQTGELRIGFLSALFYDFVPPLLLQYRQKFPNVQMTIHEMMPGQQLEALMDGTIDVAFAGLPPGRFGLGLASRVMRQDEWFVCVHNDHPLAKQPSVSLAELRSESFVFIQRSVSPPMSDLIQEIFKRGGYIPKVSQTASRAQSLLTLIAAGIGISIFPGAVSKLPSAGLVFLPLTDNLPPYEHAIVWSASNASPVLAEFLKEEAEFNKD